MSDPDMIRKIKSAVTIPVMAKVILFINCRFYNNFMYLRLALAILSKRKYWRQSKLIILTRAKS